MYIIRDKEAGNEIEVFATYEAAEAELRAYEAEDLANGTYEEDFYEIVEAEESEVKFRTRLHLAIASSGKTMKEIAELLNIPYRTIQDWKAGRRTPAPYMQQSILNQIKSI